MSSIPKKTQELRDAVKKLLVPHIESCGFAPDTRRVYNPDPFRHLFFRFMRKYGEKLELLEIQFDKYGRPKFVINLGVVPSQGVDYYGYHYAQENAGIAHLPQWARLCTRRFWGRSWFGYPFLRIPLVRNPSAEDIVQEAIRLLPQAEAWLREGIRGPNIALVRTPADQAKAWSQIGKGC